MGGRGRRAARRGIASWAVRCVGRGERSRGRLVPGWRAFFFRIESFFFQAGTMLDDDATAAASKLLRLTWNFVERFLTSCRR